MIKLLKVRVDLFYKYRHDDGENGIYKDVHEKKEYYFRDDIGQELAVFDVATDRLKTVNLYGSGSELIERLIGLGRVNTTRSGMSGPSTGMTIDSIM